MSVTHQFAKVAGGLAIAISTSWANAQALPKFVPPDGFCFHGRGVNLPIDKFLLIRRGNEVGALRILKVTPDETTKPNSNQWMGDVQYESAFAKGGESLTDRTAVHQFASLRFGRMKGFGFHYSWQSGDQEAHVGPWKLWAFWPDGFFMTTIDFWHGVNDNTGLEFAATDASSLAQLNAKDSRLTWFGSDNNRDIPCPVAVPPLQ